LRADSGPSKLIEKLGKSERGLPNSEKINPGNPEILKIPVSFVRSLTIRMQYKRIVLKLSGEALTGSKHSNIDPAVLEQYSAEIKSVKEEGKEIAIVIGGGNIFRGGQAEALGIDRVQGDYMGMLATVINAMALQSVLERHGMYTRLMSGMKMEQVCEPFIRRRAMRHLEKGRIVIFGAGIGNPYFTTDSTASLRAIEIQADVVLKGTRVDGVYTRDPEKFPDAVRYKTLSFQEAYEKNLNIMDMTAFTLCMENKLPIIVFDMNKKGNLLKVVKGEEAGTLIS
jgi:uridylate kinase